MNRHQQPCFTFSENEKPNQAWTIEKLLWWEQWRCEQELNKKAQELVDKLQEEFEEGKREILSFHRLAVAEANEQRKRQKTMREEESKEFEYMPSAEDDKSSGIDGDKIGLLSGTIENADASEVEPLVPKEDNGPPSSVHIDIIDGPHKNEEYHLCPRVRKPCFVGRSKGKKFRERGVSLYRDTEASTTHGKFHIGTGESGSKFFYTDVDSTNGTLWEGKELEGCVPLELEDGMKLKVGACLLRITLVR